MLFKKFNLNAFLCFLIIIYGFFTSFYGLFHVNPIYLFGEGVEIKPIVSLLLIFSGIIMFCIESRFLYKFKIKPLIISFCSFFTFLVIFALSYHMFLFYNIYSDHFLSFESENLINLFPSIPTLICFAIIATKGLIYIFHARNIIVRYVFGFILGLFSLSSIIGYIVDKSTLYYFIPKVNNGMSLHMTFIIMIFTFIFLNVKTRKYNQIEFKI